MKVDENFVQSGIKIGLSFSLVPSILIANRLVVFVNPSAEELLHRGPALRVVNDEFLTRRKDETAVLAELIAEMSSNLESPFSRTLVLHGRQSEASIILTFQRLCKFDLARFIVLRIADLRYRPMIDVEWIREQFGTTRSEARVAASLMTERSLLAVAISLNLSQETIRSHLKRLMQKLKVNSQVQMIGLLRDAQGAMTIDLADNSLTHSEIIDQPRTTT